VVYGDAHPINDLPSLVRCQHFLQTCASCYAGWVAVKLQENSWREVKCPENKCKTVLSYHEIQQIVAPETSQQYDKFIARADMSEGREFKTPEDLQVQLAAS
jgi:hypothetical protein